jgi:hypothetical protein
LPHSTEGDRQPDRKWLTAIAVAIIRAVGEIVRVWVQRGGHLF